MISIDVEVMTPRIEVLTPRIEVMTPRIEVIQTEKPSLFILVTKGRKALEDKLQKRPNKHKTD